MTLPPEIAIFGVVERGYGFSYKVIYTFWIYIMKRSGYVL